jgi:hypothetical protein
MVLVLHWAERGAPPHRLEQRERLRAWEEEMEADDAVFGIAQLIKQDNPELDDGYGDITSTADLHWIVVEEIVGFVGMEFMMTFHLDTNRYAPILGLKASVWLRLVDEGFHSCSPRAASNYLALSQPFFQVFLSAQFASCAEFRV